MFARTLRACALFSLCLPNVPLGATDSSAGPIRSASLHYAFSRIEAETGSPSEGVVPALPNAGAGFLEGLSDGRWVGFPRVVFDEGARGIEACVLATAHPGMLSVRIGSPRGPSIGRLEMEPADEWQTLSTEIWRVSGLQPVFLVYEGEGEARLDWVRFQSDAPAPAPVARTTRPAHGADQKAEASGTEPFDSPFRPAVNESAGIVDKPLAVEESTHDFWVHLEAEEADYSGDLRVREADDGSRYLSPIRARSWILYPQIAYSTSTRLQIRIASQHLGDWVEVRLDSRHADPVAKVPLKPSANFKEWQVLEIPLTDVPAGRHDTYLVFVDVEEKMYAGIPGTLLDPGGASRHNRTLAYLDWLAVSSPQFSTEPSLASAR